MDAIGPIIRLGPWPDITKRNWLRREDEAGRVFWHHKRERLLFQILPDPEDQDQTIARLIHVCDGSDPPDIETQQWYGSAAILLEDLARGTLSPVWVSFARNDRVPPPLTPEQLREHREAEEDWAREREEDERNGGPVGVLEKGPPWSDDIPF